MSPNLQAVLDYLARSDLDGRRGGSSLLWSILGGLMVLAVLLACALFVRAVTGGGPRSVTRVTHRYAPPPEQPTWRSGAPSQAVANYRATGDTGRSATHTPTPEPNTDQEAAA